MKTMINITEAKIQIRNILRRKHDNICRLSVIESEGKIMVVLNDKQIAIIKAKKSEDREIVENIMNLLIEQVKLQKALYKNKNNVYEILEQLKEVE